MIEIYRSTIPGDETSNPVQTELTVEERNMHLKVADLQLKIMEGASAQLELEHIRKNCKHHAFTDVAGFPYDVRYCAVCGQSLGML